MIRPFAIALLLMPLLAIADETNRGHAIAAEADRRANAEVSTLVVQATMTLRQPGGRESVRKLSMSVLATADGDRTRVELTAPPDLSGTILLTHGHPDRVEDQWLYLPAVRRVRRLSGGGRAGAFLGSEFAYEDFAPQELERFSYTYLREDNLAGVAVHVIDQQPEDPQSGYARMTVWIDAEHYRIHRIEYSDRRGKHFKTLENSDFEQFEGRYWRPRSSTMTHHASGRVTTLEWSDFQFNEPLDDARFDPASLR